MVLSVYFLIRFSLVPLHYATPAAGPWSGPIVNQHSVQMSVSLRATIKQSHEPLTSRGQTSSSQSHESFLVIWSLACSPFTKWRVWAMTRSHNRCLGDGWQVESERSPPHGRWRTTQSNYRPMSTEVSWGGLAKHLLSWGSGDLMTLVLQHLYPISGQTRPALLSSQNNPAVVGS